MGYTRDQMKTMFPDDSDSCRIKANKILLSHKEGKFDPPHPTNRAKPKNCKICKNSKDMSRPLNEESTIFEERHSFCFSCKPILDEEDPHYGAHNFVKRNGRYIIGDANRS